MTKKPQTERIPICDLIRFLYFLQRTFKTYFVSLFSRQGATPPDLFSINTSPGRGSPLTALSVNSCQVLLFQFVLKHVILKKLSNLQQKRGGLHGRNSHHISCLCYSRRSQLLHMQMAGQQTIDSNSLNGIAHP